MSAPVLWIIVPILVGGFALTFLDERSRALTGGIASFVLAGLAMVIPIDEALLIGPISLKVASSAFFFGRSLVLPGAQAPLLVVIYGLCGFWFLGAQAAQAGHRLVPYGLVVTALLVASIAVQPFLFASILIEMAVLVAVPLMAPPEQGPGRGVIRFLIYQTLGMPFILFAGWLLAGVETSPSDLSLTIQATVMLGLGFAFLLAIFPLSTWIPQIMEDCHPYVAAFLLWVLPSMVVVFAMGFLDRYAWLRTSPEVIAGLRGMGLIMVVSGALWAAFQQHLGRIMAHMTIAETGFLLLALSLAAGGSENLVFVLLIPRGLALAVWALALSVFKASGSNLELTSIRGWARRYPWASAGLIVAALSTAGFPLLAAFPPRLALWQGLIHDSFAVGFWFLLSLLGLMIAAIRQIGALVLQQEHEPWAPQESLTQRGMLGAGVLGLFILGIFPEAIGFVTNKLPLMFLHLNR